MGEAMVKRMLRRGGLAILLALAWLSLAWLAMALAEESDRPAATAQDDVADPAHLRILAERGDPEAQYALAHSYHLGNGVEQDMAAAWTWYEKAARQGHESAQLALGDQYRMGLAVPRDPVQAVRWYRLAAEQGNAFAQYELGNAYRYGTGVPQSLVQAIRWYVASAEADNPAAELALAELEAADAVGVEAAATTPTEAAAMEPRAAETAAPSEDQTVARLLAQADEQMANLALTVPAGDNAYETYQEVLSLQPDNRAARDGITRVGARYADLANLAAAKGDLHKARHYAAKAELLAPEHPAVLALAIPEEPEPSPVEAAVKATEPPAEMPAEQPPETPTEVLTAVAAPRPRPEGPAEVAAAVPAETSPASPNESVSDTDDLIFQPQAYQGRELMVTGTVARLFGRYLLTSESGQNSLVIDVDGLDPAARADLRDAFDRAGFLGQVEARITGRIVRQTPVTFALAARELALAAPGAPFETAAGASESATSVWEDPSAPPAAPVGSQSAPAPTPNYVPTCYRDTVWRRLADGRIQTGTRTRCY